MTDSDDELMGNLPAEMLVIAAAMTSPDAAMELAERLAGPQDFGRKVHQELFGALGGLAVGGEQTDPITLRHHLRSKGRLDPLTERAILDVSTMFTTMPQALAAADIVAELAERQRVKDAAGRLLRSSHNPQVPVAEAVEQFATELDRARHPDAKRPEKAGTSWRPLDLTAILNGTAPKVEPTIGLTRTDGLALLYPGKEHSVLGEMESGKSWFSAASCAAELLKGEHILYIHFEETDPTDTVERLRVLGVPDAVILERFRFVGPLEPVRPQFLAALLDPAPTLVVLDGVNEAMSLHGQAIREEDGAAAFRRVLVKPCTSVGAAVLACDHVVKDREARGRYGIGSVHKGNGINGSLIMLESAEPFGRGQRGRSSVFVTKDRPGQLRQHGNPQKIPGKTFMGSLIVDDTRTKHPHLDLKFGTPSPDGRTEDTDVAGDRLDAVANTVAKLDQAGIGTELGRDKVRAEARGKGITLPGNDILSKAISVRKERASRAGDLSRSLYGQDRGKQTNELSPFPGQSALSLQLRSVLDRLRTEQDSPCPADLSRSPRP